MKTVAIIQARMSSTRFPGKVLASLDGRPMIAVMIERVRQTSRVDEIVLATSLDTSDTALAECIATLGVRVFRGSLDDVLGRFAMAAREAEADVVIRLTGDCPLIDPAVIDAVIDLRARTGADYASNIDPPTFPDGLDCEVFLAETLQRADTSAMDAQAREHVTLWMRRPEAQLTRQVLRLPFDASGLRLTVDYPDDLVAVARVLELVGKPDPDLFDMLRVLSLHPEISATNRHQRNEALADPE